jgi:predicted DNA-binding protein (UPF0278 family)
MDVPEFLRDEFIEAWDKKTFRSITGSINEVRSAFNITAVDRNVNQKINEAFDSRTQERYQRTALRTLVSQYVDELYILSDLGRTINESITMQAKINLKSRGCPVQPC